MENQITDENKAIRLSYGLGWGLYWTPYGKAFFKEGHDEGFRNYAVCFDRAKNGIVILTNSSNGEGIFKDILETVLGNKFTPIEWEGFTPYDKLPPRASLVGPQRSRNRSQIAGCVCRPLRALGGRRSDDQEGRRHAPHRAGKSGAAAGVGARG